LQSVALAVPEIIRLQFWGGLRTLNIGEGEALRGQGWYRLKERLWLPMGSS